MNRRTQILSVVGAAVLLVFLVWFWQYTPPAVAPARAASPGRVATSQNWTINDIPVEDGIMLRAGEQLKVSVDVDLFNDGSIKPRTAWSPSGPWVAGKDVLDVWMRFAQQHPLIAREAKENLHSLIRNRPKRPEKTHRVQCRAPLRVGDYELQLVVHKRKFGAFPVDQVAEGDIVQVARVHVASVD